jgi:hypothetical protein
MLGFRPRAMGVGLVLIALFSLAVPARALAQSTMTQGQTLGLLLLLGLSLRPPAAAEPATKGTGAVRKEKPRAVAGQATASESGDPQRAKPH